MRKNRSYHTYRAEVVAYSKNNITSLIPDELISFKLVFPRIVLPEFNTHRMFSKNTSSSRAIPFKKMLSTVLENPFIPIAFQKPHKKMQGNDYYTDDKDILEREKAWLDGLYQAEKISLHLSEDLKITKQLCNRLIEPYSWVQMLMTTSIQGLHNFFELRCPRYQRTPNDPEFKSWSQFCDFYSRMGIYSEEPGKKHYTEYTIEEQLKLNKSYADIHISRLAELMYDAYMDAKQSGPEFNDEYHIPFRKEIMREYGNLLTNEEIAKISVAKSARFSYTTFDKQLTKDEQIELFNDLISQDPPHSSPLEHVAYKIKPEEYESYYRTINKFDPKSTENYGWCNNFKGFIPYRYIIDKMNKSGINCG